VTRAYEGKNDVKAVMKIQYHGNDEDLGGRGAKKSIDKRTRVLVLEWLIGQGSWSWYSSIGISIRIICVGFPLKE